MSVFIMLHCDIQLCGLSPRHHHPPSQFLSHHPSPTSQLSNCIKCTILTNEMCYLQLVNKCIVINSISISFSSVIPNVSLGTNILDFCKNAKKPTLNSEHASMCQAVILRVTFSDWVSSFTILPEGFRPGCTAVSAIEPLSFTWCAGHCNHKITLSPWIIVIRFCK